MGELATHIANHPFLAAGLLAAVAAVVFVEVRLRSQGRTQVAPVDAVKMINDGALVVDVRSPEAFRNGHIVNARNVELDQVGPGHSMLKKHKNKVLITVCDNGLNSGKAASRLRQAGFEKVFSLKGGLDGWRAENLPVVK